MKNFIFFTCASICCAYPLKAQNLSKTMIFDGQTRSYRIYIPVIYDSSQPVPLVMALHGLGDNATNFQGVGFNQLANTENFIAVYPNALVDQLLGGTAWNTGIYPGNNNEDVGFLNVLLDTIIARYSIDTNRIYCTGFSLGAFMTYRLACESGERFAAVAAVSGCLPAPSIANCYSERPMPVMHIHGTSDQTIPYNLGTIYFVVTNLGADSTTHYWAIRNGCDSPTHDSLPNTKNDGLTFEKYSYSACRDSSEVILIKANGMQHTWPYAPANDVDATDEIWNFFGRHRKAASADTTTTSLQDIEREFEVYPNPTSGVLFLKSNEQKVIEVTLSDLAGRVIYTNRNISELEINLKDISSGTYFLQLKMNDNILSKKIIKF